MTTLAEPDAPPPQPTFEPADHVSLAALSPIPGNSSSHILANVALVWPYSSSTGTLALLLADPDIRARKARGQVKVVFRHGSAREVASTKVGIGDTIRLALVGCEWKETGETVSTPGKKIDWDLEFKNRVIIQVSRDDAVIASLNYTAPEDDIPTTNGALEILSSLRDVRPQLNGTLVHEPSTIHVPFVTPSKSARKFPRTTFFDASLDPFAENDGYIQGRGRKRTKFARHSGAWNLLDSEDEGTSVRTPQQPAVTAALGESPSRQEIDLTSSPLGDTSVDQTPVREQRRIQGEGHATSQEYAQEQYRAEEEAPHQIEANSFGRQEIPAETGHHDQWHHDQLQRDEDSQYIAEQPIAQEEHLADNLAEVARQAILGAANSVEITSQDLPAQTAEQSTSQSIVMGPPQTPMRIFHLPAPEEFSVASPSGTSSDATNTPRLHPLASPGLPLVSPLVRKYGVENGYFPAFQEGVSQLDATRMGAADEEANDLGEALLGIQDAHVGHGGEYEANQEASKFHDELETSLDVAEESSNQTPTSATASPYPPTEPHLRFPSASQDFEAPTAASNILNEALHSERPESTATEQWLSNAELTIAHELLQPNNESQNLGAVHQATEVIEIEDDDLYGASPDVAQKPASPSKQSALPNQRKSPLDVVEQFLQLSPVAGTTEETQFGATAVEVSTARSASEDTTEEGPTITTVSYPSPGIYHENSLSPEQQWEQLGRSEPISRGFPATHTPGVSSLDGHVDEPEDSTLAQEHVADVSKTGTMILEHSEGITQPEVTDIDMADESGAPILLQTSKAKEDVAHEIIMEEIDEAGTQEEDDLAIIGEQPSVSQNPDVVTRPSTIGVVERDDSLAVMPQVLIEDAHEVLDSLREDRPRRDEASRDHEAEEITITEQRRVFFSQEGHLEDTSFTTTTGPKAGGQLPSPDQTQLDNHSVERDGEMKSPQLHPSVAHGLPSPIQTQEEPIAPSIEETTRSQTDKDAAAEIWTQPQAETPGPRRISQRLSVRRSIMPNDISSPYFTPRRPPREPPSSPMIKENIKPFVPSVSGSSPPPVYGREASAEAPETFAQINVEKTVTIQDEQKLRVFAPRTLGTTTPLAYYPYLTSLHEHFSQLVDIIAVCIQDCPQPERAKSGPKDYHTTMRVVDSSSQSDAITVQIFRPVKIALPTPRRGDAVLLRNFKVQTLNRKFMLLSTESSSWAVFQARQDGNPGWTSVLTPGPPLEYGPHEEEYATSLLSWWEEDGNNRFESSNHDMIDTNMSNGAKTPRQKPLPANRRRGNRADNIGNEGDVAEDIEGESHESIPPTDTTNHDLNGPTMSTVPSSPGTAMITEPIPRRSVRLRQSASPVMEMNNGSQFARDHDADHEANEISENWSKENSRRRGSTVSVAPSSPKMSMKEGTPQRNTRSRRSASPLQDTSFGGNDEAGTTSPETLRNRRRGSTVSIASSTPKPGTTKEVGRRHSVRHRKSPSLVHELRDGTKYVDDGQQPGRGSVVHELRDGATYVDE
ncbi:hypothetical protein LTR96_004460 [Exophiala xenobiotica]|nr:hypothetical protein LTR92_008277 [Exophiala xenobiotica]KAK5269961.1 hypothetical protein LTR96_004460 [Exophiala xenobiotica]KAK5340082.1 hypothetical protein LTR98_003202 [Exophiala xenobiotica]